MTLPYQIQRSHWPDQRHYSDYCSDTLDLDIFPGTGADVRLCNLAAQLPKFPSVPKK